MVDRQDVDAFPNIGDAGIAEGKADHEKSDDKGICNSVRQAHVRDYNQRI
jgi:hypothetical protein